jgi:hypothetical protein
LVELPTFNAPKYRNGKLYIPRLNKYIGVDTRDLVKFKDFYYIRNRDMDYVRMELNYAYGEDGDIRSVHIEKDEEYDTI